MRVNRVLKAMLIVADGKISRSAKAVGMSLVRLSQIVNGHCNPREDEIQKIVEHLNEGDAGIDASRLFPPEVLAAAQEHP